MANPIWITKAGNLGLVPENQYFEIPLEAYNPGEGFGAKAIISQIVDVPPYNTKDLGHITEIKIIDPGQGYNDFNTRVQITGGQGFLGDVTVVGGGVTGINIRSGGYGYSTQQSVITFNRNITFKHIAGKLPPGLHVSPTGALQGVPVLTDTTNVDRSYQFTVRATNLAGLVADRTFKLTITNIVPPQIYPRTENLGTYFDGQYFTHQLTATEANRYNSPVWSLNTGSLPPGLSLSTAGVISGFILPVPTTDSGGATGYGNVAYGMYGFENSASFKNNTYKFSVKVDDGVNYDTVTYSLTIEAKGNYLADSTLATVDNTFITVDTENSYVPIITTPPQSIPSVRSNSNFAFKFDAYSPQGRVDQFGIVQAGGSTFDQDGSDRYNSQATLSTIVFDANATTTTYSVNTNIYFPTYTVTFDSVYFVWANTDVVGFTQGSDYDVIGTTVTFHTGVIPGTGKVAVNLTVAPPANPVPVTGVPFDSTGFDQPNQTIPQGLVLDTNTGWLTGTIGNQPEATKTYTFKVYAQETDAGGTVLTSVPVEFQLTVLGDINNTISWVTGQNLGTIDNGSVSELSVVAISNANKPLIYKLVDYNSRLPQGLKLLPSGLITGRCTFEYFSLDKGSTTIDGGLGVFDNVYSFTVQATSTDQTVSSQQTFTIRINNYNKLPYEDLYISAFPEPDQRQLFLDIMSRSDIFPADLIYRSEDPWFGKSTHIRSLFLAGLNPFQAKYFIEAMQHNHYTKTIEFGKIKTARALDANFNVKYEVVYVELEDNSVSDGQSPAQSMTLHNANPWYDSQGNGYAVFEPNSFNNMTAAVAGKLGYAHQGALPDWMTSVQENGTVLGFTRAVVLAYVKPNYSKLIAYRLNANGIVFNDIEFAIDRYSLDNHLTANFDTSTNKFITSKETTFDRITRIGKTKYTVTFAVRNLEFDRVHNQTVGFIQGNGGFDSITAFNDGDTLIFAQQENYIGNTTNYDGWNDTVTGLPVPGFLEHAQNPAVPNQRAGIWRIRILNNVPIPASASQFGSDLVGFDSRAYDDQVDWPNPPVQLGQVVRLEFVNQVEPNDIIQVNQGASASNTLVYYDPILKSGNRVPDYSYVRNAIEPGNKNTVFDHNGTRFLNDRDTYSVPESDDKYLKFPKTGVFK